MSTESDGASEPAGAGTDARTQKERVPFSDRTTRHGLPADQLVSCLQKYIRRGNLEQACLVAYELATSGEDLADLVWQRLQVISCEDVGTGMFVEPVVIDSLFRMWGRLDPEAPDRWLMLVHGVRFLVSRTKDRMTDELVNWLRREVDEIGRTPVIPDWALDMHTEQGQSLGRGLRHFLEVGAQVENESPERDLTYRRYLLDHLD